MAVRIFGIHDEQTIRQLETCVAAEEGAVGVLCADGHLGYSMPIGGVVAYRDHISPSGVGFDIGCGNLAVRTALTHDQVEADLPRIMDEIFERISFGVGRSDGRAADHAVIDAIRTAEFAPQRELTGLAAKQLGTVGSGNHYVDLFRDEDDDRVWIGVHFGSRGFGHKTASGFLALAQGRPFDGRAHEGEMMSPPVVFDAASGLGAELRRRRWSSPASYAYAAARSSSREVLAILGTEADVEVHNHHNYAWREDVDGAPRLGRPQGRDAGLPGPARLRRRDDGRAGGDPRGRRVARGGHRAALDGPRRGPRDVAHEGGGQARHAAGVLRPRLPVLDDAQGTRALPATTRDARLLKRRGRISAGAIDFPTVRAELAARGIELRGGAADEAPAAYKRLDDVLAHHAGSVRVLHRLHPIGVAMAPAETFDPYKD